MKRSLSLLLFFCMVSVLLAQDTVSLLFVGDLMQHREQIAAAQTSDSYSYESCFRHVRDEIARADLTVGNLELTLGGKPYAGYPLFSAPDAYLEALKQAGFDVLLTANNHCLDRGKKGLERTIRQLDSLQLHYAGTYVDSVQRAKRYPLCIEKNGFTLVFLNYTYGTNGIAPENPNVVNYIDREQMRSDISRAQAMKPDAIIACVHWGVEYERLPHPSQKELADWLIAQGVTHVIGSHPHVLQPMELRPCSKVPDNHVVAYSLGNFISNMSARHTDGGAMLKLELTRKYGITRLSNCRYSLVWTSRPVLSKQQNYMLYPACIGKQLLNEAERYRMNRFLNDARTFLDRHNVGIEEYVF